ncbi:SPOR domain-containing protein [Pedobacter sp. SL55]|uniref:SPOR domain-containing protein n=1 Tax=Pedobacter sp. SL55 TaxID=2995161 RepID=UPI00226EA4FE|nr:SPOR domain-containing protein [Pedobacter sp. SL55]WAC39422.1 SPOR domain-containing protein [Pedobacter sp. SL55]
MDILQYLIALLKTRKQIGIEGLGTLYKKKTPGRYDAETHSFLPPSYALEFTTAQLENTALSEYIQNKRGISADSAQYFINQFVAEVQQSLANGAYELANLGTLQKADGHLTFTPSQDINTGFDFFALPPVTAAISPASNEEPEEFSKPETVAEQPQIEQVQVPEFEQEINKLEFTDKTSTSKESENVDIVEEQTVTEQLESLNAANQDTASLAETEQEPTAPETFEEVRSVDTNNEVEQEDDQDTWDFEKDNVISEEDLNTEETFVENEAGAAITFTKEEKPEDFKLNSTTQEWNFDTIERKAKQEENVLIEDFDSEELEEQAVAEKTKMPFYQKLLLGLLMVAVALVILYFVRPAIFENFKRDNTNPNEKIAVPIERSNLKSQTDSLSFADSIMKSAEKVGLEVEKAKDTLKVTTTKTAAPTTYTYDVIIASFATEKKASDYVSRMRKKGFDAKISTMHGKRKNISIATYNHIDSAQKYVIKFRKQFNNKDIYAQPIKNK